jgi:hypothetical protein
MKGRAMGWYGFVVGLAGTVVIGSLFIASCSPDAAPSVAKFIRRDVLPLWNHGQDPQHKAPPLVREDKKEGTLVRVRPD